MNITVIRNDDPRTTSIRRGRKSSSQLGIGRIRTTRDRHHAPSASRMSPATAPAARRSPAAGRPRRCRREPPAAAVFRSGRSSPPPRPAPIAPSPGPRHRITVPSPLREHRSLGLARHREPGRLSSLYCLSLLRSGGAESRSRGCSAAWVAIAQRVGCRVSRIRSRSTLPRRCARPGPLVAPAPPGRGRCAWPPAARSAMPIGRLLGRAGPWLAGLRVERGPLPRNESAGSPSGRDLAPSGQQGDRPAAACSPARARLPRQVVADQGAPSPPAEMRGAGQSVGVGVLAREIGRPAAAMSGRTASQRGQLDRHHVQAVEEILSGSRRTLTDALQDRAVRGSPAAARPP